MRLHDWSTCWLTDDKVIVKLTRCQPLKIWILQFLLILSFITDWLFDWLTDWQTDWLIDWSTDWLRLSDWLIDRLRLTSWLTCCLTNWRTCIIDWRLMTNYLIQKLLTLFGNSSLQERNWYLGRITELFKNFFHKLLCAVFSFLFLKCYKIKSRSHL